MDRTSLTTESKDQGAAILRALDRVGLSITACLWFWDEKAKNWILIMATPLIDQQGPKLAYTRLLNSLPKDTIDIGSISLVSPNHPLIDLLRVAIRTEPDVVGGIDFQRNTINNTYIEAAYIYRIT